MLENGFLTELHLQCLEDCLSLVCSLGNLEKHVSPKETKSPRCVLLSP